MSETLPPLDETACFRSSDVKRMGAVTIARNGYIQEIEEQRDEALEKLKNAEERIDELKQDRDIIHQDAERWRKIATEWKARHDEIHIANESSDGAAGFGSNSP